MPDGMNLGLLAGGIGQTLGGVLAIIRGVTYRGRHVLNTIHHLSNRRMTGPERGNSMTNLATNLRDGAWRYADRIAVRHDDETMS